MVLCSDFGKAVIRLSKSRHSHSWGKSAVSKPPAVNAIRCFLHSGEWRSLITMDRSAPTSQTGIRAPIAQQSSVSKPTRLSCEMCCQRKVKCDKSYPCANCCRGGIQCVPVERKRLPRGRYKVSKEKLHKNSTSVLPDSIGRLESLVKEPASDHRSNVSEVNTVPRIVNPGRVLSCNSPAPSGFGPSKSAAPPISRPDGAERVVPQGHVSNGGHVTDNDCIRRQLGDFSWTDLVGEVSRTALVDAVVGIRVTRSPVRRLNIPTFSGLLRMKIT
jgi:hypothetical protein